MDKPHPALQDPNAKREGGFFVMDGEKSADHCETLAMARTNGQKFCDENFFPSRFWISDFDGEFVEEISRSDGRGLGDMIQGFNEIFGKAKSS